MKVIKRDKRVKQFDINRIKDAVYKAYVDVSDECTFKEEYPKLEVLIKKAINSLNKSQINIEEIQDIVTTNLKTINPTVEKSYTSYRNYREEQRIKNSKKERFYNEVLNCSNIDNDNANVDQHSFSGRKYRIADYEQKQYALRNLISKEGRKAFEDGEIYYHDLSSYAIGEHNCSFLDIGNGIKEGFTTRNGDVRPANSYATACQLVAVMFQCQSQVQYGGVGANIFDFDLEDSVKKSFRKYYIKGLRYIEGLSKYTSRQITFNIPKDFHIDDEEYKQFTGAYNYAMEELECEGKQATQGLYHNLNTLESRAGSQLPFTSINLGRNTTFEGRLINKWVFNASIEGIGSQHKTSIFPISIFQYKRGVNAKPGDPNYDIKQLAIKSLSKRIYPNIVNGDYKQNIEDPNDPRTFMATMGCRTLVTYDIHNDNYVKTGRGNLSPITIILPKLGLDWGIKLGQRTKPDLEGFWKHLDSISDLVIQELITRYHYIVSQSPKSAPFMYRNTLMMNSTNCNNTVENCLKHGTNALGILGMAECCIALFGKHHGESVEAYNFALEVVKFLYDKCKSSSHKYNMNFSLYYTPAENLCKTAVETLRIHYGKVEGVTDKEYLTNSIHIPVYYQLDAYSKLVLEAPFTQYGTGGCITYVELDNSAIHNPEGIEKLIDFAMDLNIPYLAINFPINTCLDCGTTFNEDKDNCPNCNSTNLEMLKRVTGYITGNYKTAFNKGKQQEAEQRVVHTIYNPEVAPIISQAYNKLKEMGIGEFNEIQ